MSINRSRLCNWNAEFVFRLSRGNLGMCLGIHVRIDADSDRRLHTQLQRNRVEPLHLGLTLDIELSYTPRERHTHFVTRFSNT